MCHDGGGLGVIMGCGDIRGELLGTALALVHHTLEATEESNRRYHTLVTTHLREQQKKATEGMGVVSEDRRGQ